MLRRGFVSRAMHQARVLYLSSFSIGMDCASVRTAEIFSIYGEVLLFQTASTHPPLELAETAVSPQRLPHAQYCGPVVPCVRIEGRACRLVRVRIAPLHVRAGVGVRNVCDHGDEACGLSMREGRGVKDIVQHSVVWQNNKLQVDVSHEVIARVQDDPHALIWLDLEGEPHAQGPMLAKTFGLSQITIDTIEEEHERAKLVRGHNYFYLVVHALTYDAKTDGADTPKLDIAFGQNYVLTVHRTPLPWLTALRESLRAGKLEENIMSRGAAMLLHAVLDTLVDSYFPVLDELDDIIDQLENATVQQTSNAVQARIFRMKRVLAHMRRVISPQVEVANSLITRTGDLIPREAEPSFLDVHDHLVRAFEVIDSYRDLMSGLLDVYLTTVSNRVNEIMRQLTIISTIFLPITFITGVFGQNFGHAPQVEHDGGWNFWVALALMGAITAVQIWYFKRRGWL